MSSRNQLSGRKNKRNEEKMPETGTVELQEMLQAILSLSDQLKEQSSRVEAQLKEQSSRVEAQLREQSSRVEAQLREQSSRFDDLDRRMGYIERTMGAIQSYPAPYDRPKTFHSATEFHSVSAPIRKRQGYMG